MYQFYLLSVLTNILAGLTLTSGYMEEKLPSLTHLQKLLEGQGVKITLGIITFITGILKLLSVSGGGMVFFGDLIPAFSGLLLGGTLLLDYYKTRSEVTSPAVEKMDSIFLQNKTLIGSAGMLAGLIHFILPGVVLL